MPQIIDFLCTKQTKLKDEKGKETGEVEDCDGVLVDQYRGEKHNCPKCGSPMREGFGATQGNAVWRHNDTRMPKE